MSAIYLYGVIQGTPTGTLNVPGVDGAGPVHIVAHNGLGGVVSHCRGEDFQTMPRERLMRSLLAHQKVVECVMGECDVLPVKFGTVFSDHPEVLGFLSHNHRELADAMAGIRDKIEVEVAATWDIQRVLADIAQEEEVACARQDILHQGQATMEQRVQLGQMVKARLDKRRDSYRERMASLLRPLSIDMSPNALLSDEMVMNVAFLVDRGQVGRFYAGVEQLDRLFGSEVSFRVIGPLPPYSFSTVEVTRLTREQVDMACQALGLRDAIAEAEVKRSFRGLAAELWRGLQVGDRLAKERFIRLKQSSQVLLSYCRAQKEGRPASLEPDPASLLVATVRRAGSDEIEASCFSAVDAV